ncbi:hypothetical protein SUDANB58_01939 [Streptomyces sp. enrichment culture]|uniref:hypothetical protein n=1 Tax=Streptomyces sp. enrichment culture TaxID=1795815 RepID=UPI003F57FC55
MRLPARPIATSALCATLLLCAAGPAAVAADGDPVRERTRTAPRAPLPGADELNAQVQTLSGLGGVITPVTELLGAVLEDDDGRLTAQQADRLGDAVDAAIDDALAKAGAVAAPTAPGTTAPSATTPGTAAPGANTPARPPAVAQPNGDAPATTLPAPLAPAQAGGGLVGAAFDALRQAIDALLGVSTTGRPDQVGPAVADVVTDVVNVATATLTGGGLPAPDLAGLQPLPAAPNGPAPASTLPDTPANSS